MRKPLQSRGFTVVELLVATVVFGLVLLVVTTAILQLTRVYYKGLTDAKVQETTRSIADTIAQGIQFSSGVVSDTPSGPGVPAAGSSYDFCIGNTQYSYTIGYQLSDNPTASQTPHALMAADVAGCTGLAAQNVRVDSGIIGREMLAPGMRLTRLEVRNISAGYYHVSIRVVYGDDELLNNPNGNATCKSQRAGTQFCSISDITVAVTKRLE